MGGADRPRPCGPSWPKKDPGLIELSQDQRFFIANAYRWAQKARDEYLATLVQTDPHAPAQVRAVQPARNMEVLRGVRHRAGRPGVSATGGAHRHLVETLPASGAVTIVSSDSMRPID